MSRFVPAIFLAACLPFAVLAAAVDSSPVASVDIDPRVSVVQVHCWTGTAGGSGTGTVVGTSGTKSLVVTNHHVAPVSGDYYEVWVGGEKLKAKWVKADENPDLAALSVDVPLTPARISRFEPRVGNLVRHWGKTTGPQTGKISGTTDFAKALTNDADYVSDSGDSGSGVFDLTGQLVGVHWGRTADPDDTNVIKHMATVKNLRTFLKPIAAPYPDLVKTLNTP